MSGSLAVLQTTKAVVPGSNPASLSIEPSPTNSSCMNLPQGWAADPCPPPCPAPPWNNESKSTQTYLNGGQPIFFAYHPVQLLLYYLTSRVGNRSFPPPCSTPLVLIYLRGGQLILAHHPVQLLLVTMGLNLHKLTSREGSRTLFTTLPTPHVHAVWMYIHKLTSRVGSRSLPTTLSNSSCILVWI